MDLYVILGLARGASDAAIKRAYRRLARRYHPDINPGDRAGTAAFQQIAEAYRTLGDAARRRHYDATGGAPDPDQSASFGFEGFDFAPQAGAGSSTFGDLFADVISGAEARRSGSGPQPGADLHAVVSIGFEESLGGTDRHVTLTRRDRCRACAGAGMLRGLDAHCPRCLGTGRARSVRGHMIFARPCAACGGSGRERERPCATCGSHGVETRSDTFTVRIPAGIADGMRVRVPGKGHAGVQGGAAGDVYVTVQVAPHSLFRREGDDLHLTVPIAIHEAGLGAKIEVPTLEGPARLRVPPGTQSGQRFRLRERGMPSLRGGRRGALVVEVRLVLPTLIDERSKELLREFGQRNAENVRASLAGC